MGPIRKGGGRKAIGGKEMEERSDRECGEQGEEDDGRFKEEPYLPE